MMDYCTVYQIEHHDGGWTVLDEDNQRCSPYYTTRALAEAERVRLNHLDHLAYKHRELQREAWHK